MRPICLAAAFLLLASISVAADSTTGKIFAFDRSNKILVLEDRTVWLIVPADLPLPADLRTGDSVMIEFRKNGDNRVDRIISIARLNDAPVPFGSGPPRRRQRSL